MPTICVPAKTTDVDTLLRLMREYYAHDRIRFDRRVQRPALARLLRDGSLGSVFLIRHGGVTAGYVVLTFDYGLEEGGREVMIDELYLREPHRGRGLGARALSFVERWCGARRVRAIHVAVERANRGALGFYRKAGFSLPGRRLLSKRVARSRPRAIVGRLRRAP